MHTVNFALERLIVFALRAKQMHACQERLVEKEGHKIISWGKRLFVKDYEKTCKEFETISAWET